MSQIKRLILCCDGTWNDSVSTNNPLTNVARFSRIVEERAEDGTLQIVYYHTGVGAGTSRISNSIDGAVGRGLGANVRNAYNFLCQNFNHKDCNDEIFLVGFSRGAFTVRCVASLVDSIGILTKPGLSRLYEAYGLWKNQQADSGSALKAYVENLEKQGLTKAGIKIKVCGVWDTVSAIGVQLPAWLPQPPPKRLAHVDNRIPPCVEHAFHAMALNERRSAFWPIPWSEPRDGTKLRQCWFLGAHADVGGGYEDASLANVAMVWMVAQFQHFTSLAFDVTYLLDFLVTKEIESTTKEIELSMGVPGIHVVGKSVETMSRYKSEPGKIANSFTLLWHPFGQRPRKPGLSYLTNKVQHSIGLSGAKDDLGVTSSFTPQLGLNAGLVVDSERADIGSDTASGTQTLQPSQATCDTIHFTVRVFLAKQYHSCQVLKKLYTTNHTGSDQKVRWRRRENEHTGKGKSSVTKPDQQLSIDEAEVTEKEMALLKLWLNAAASRGILKSHNKTTEASFSLSAASGFPEAYKSKTGGSSSRGTTEEFSIQNAEEAKTILERRSDAAFSEMWLLLYAYLDEGVKPTLMYNADAPITS